MSARVRGQEDTNAAILAAGAAGLAVPFQDTVSLTLLHSVNRDLVQGRAERNLAHVHDGRFVIRELSFSLGAVCTEAGVSVDSSELCPSLPREKLQNESGQLPSNGEPRVHCNM